MSWSKSTATQPSIVTNDILDVSTKYMTMKRLYITGVGGFVGQSLMHLLADSSTNSDFELITPNHRIDIRDAGALATFIEASRPTHVVHLAAQSHVPASIKDPKTTLDINLYGTLNLLQALERSGFDGVVLYVGSSDVYGRVEPSRLPIREDYLLRPLNPYAVSKVSAEALCYQWSQSGSFRIVMARPFNHIGPRQSERFVVPCLAKQIAEIGAGLRPNEILHGDIDVTRDFTDVRDVVRAYLLLLELGQNGEIYNVCSGIERSPRELLERLLSLSGIKAKVKRDENRMRSSEQRRASGSFEKLQAHTSWKPEIGIDQSLSDILAFWLERVARKKVQHV
jgi:GDP-4-dehydro-6-deoxy-D-mannose reductase